MSKHTPGPWKQHVDDTGKIYANVRDATGRCVADCGSRTDKDAQANAALIAAAPDLYEAFIKCPELPEDFSEHNPDSVVAFRDAFVLWVDAAKAAIAKAEGKLRA